MYKPLTCLDGAKDSPRIPRVRAALTRALLIAAVCLPPISFLTGCAGRAQTASPVAQAASPTPAQSGTRASDLITRPTSDPYTGSLSIFEDPKRDEKLQISRVMDILGIKEGSNVADIGAGSGWFTVRAARRVGATGSVYAVEINPDYLKHIEKRAQQENFPNIHATRGKEDRAPLPTDTIDAVLLLKTYHEIAQPVRLLKSTLTAMRATGRLGIIDRNGSGDDHGLDSKVVIREAEQAGFSLINQYDFVKPDGMDYFLVFAPKRK